MTAGVRMCSTMSKLQEKRVYVVKLLRMNQHGAGLQEAAVGAGLAHHSRHGMVRLPAGHGAEQTKNCRTEMTLGSESCCVCSDLRIGSCLCSGLTPLFVDLVCNGQAGKVGEQAHP